MAASYNKVLSKAQVDAELKRLGARAAVNRAPDYIIYNVRGGGQARASTVGPGKIRLEVFAGQCPCEKK